MAAATLPESGPDGAAGAALDPDAVDAAFDTRERIGWRRRLLILATLAACVGLFFLARGLAAAPQIPATWDAGPGGKLLLHSSPLPTLDLQRGRALASIAGPGGAALPVDARLLQHALRWQVDDAARRAEAAQRRGLARRLEAARDGSTLALNFADGGRVDVAVQPRGYAGLGWIFWPLSGTALLLYLFGCVLLLSRPQRRNLLFVTMSLCQAANLLLIAIETLPGLTASARPLLDEPLLRAALDLATVAAIVQACALYPTRLAHSRALGSAAWATAALPVSLAAALPALPQWWLIQGTLIALAATALAVVQRSHRSAPNPYTLVLRRFGAAALATLALATLVVALAARTPLAAEVAAGASTAWYLFFASLLLLTPLLTRSRRLLREFALLAGISTVATSIDLLFVSVFAFSPSGSLAFAIFVALGVYAGARQWALDHLLGSGIVSTERIFGQLYRAARAVQAQPARYGAELGQLMRALFDPIEVQALARAAPRSHVAASGAALIVPLRGDEAGAALVLRHARRGQRLFSDDDARLADRVVEQLRRAVEYDQAVERGRSEERLRIAQDLHDDIGARLLTLMYQAPTPEIEDYLRHTLQDLKTLTRGLAAPEQPLSQAAAEWKADLTQRLSAADARLHWSATLDRDPLLTVVQWSALTRVLRELVSNALYHGHAQQVEVTLLLQGGELRLQVADDGLGADPGSWSHGLGLGGVRKRVKLLGGEVEWRDRVPRGIVCTMRVGAFCAPD
ncbi:MAG: histidine kinase [Burkholderiales bacterium]|nr:histidine kinase [Burkholderiales bacterium]MDE1928584.1 histidine kinase [Burkholderiales bacterium]MDE2160795.1 histidine kinase [Burkholderiales bacterium]MDE2504261.1 histidine kinase [Burkholderiales bacterium]